MPVLKCSNGKYRIGSGTCMYKSKASAERAYAAYRAIKHSKGGSMDIDKIVSEAVKEATSGIQEEIAESIFEEFKTKVSEAFRRASFDVVRKCGEANIGAGSTYALLNDLINDWLTKEFIETPINE